MLKILKHTLIVASLLFLFIGIPFLVKADNLMNLGTIDAKASASIDLSQYNSKGEFTIIINKNSFSEKLTNRLISYFDGTDRDSSIFITKKDILSNNDKIKMTVINKDIDGINMAKYYQGAIANGAAITLDSDEGIIVVSKLELGKLDLVCMSDAYQKVFNINENIDNLIVLHVKENTIEEQ